MEKGTVIRMKRKYCIGFTFIIITVLCSMFSGCVMIFGALVSADGFKFVSDNKNVSVIASIDWENDTQLNEESILHISNTTNDEYVIVMEEPKETFSTDLELSEYTNTVLSNAENELINTDISDIFETTIDGNPSQYFQVSGEYDGMNVTFLYYCVETHDCFYQLVGWTQTPYFDDNKQELMKILESFTVTKKEDDIL